MGIDSIESCVQTLIDDDNKKAMIKPLNPCSQNQTKNDTINDDIDASMLNKLEEAMQKTVMSRKCFGYIESSSSSLAKKINFKSNINPLDTSNNTEISQNLS